MTILRESGRRGAREKRQEGRETSEERNAKRAEVKKYRDPVTEDYKIVGSK